MFAAAQAPNAQYVQTFFYALDVFAPVLTIAEFVTRERLRLKLSLRAFGQFVGASQTAVSDWEKGRRTPDPMYCIRLAVKLNTPVDEVLQMAGHMPLQPVETPELPDWANLLPMLSKADAEYVGRLVQSLAASPAQPDEPPDQGAP